MQIWGQVLHSNISQNLQNLGSKNLGAGLTLQHHNQSVAICRTIIDTLMPIPAKCFSNTISADPKQSR